MMVSLLEAMNALAGAILVLCQRCLLANLHSSRIRFSNIGFQSGLDDQQHHHGDDVCMDKNYGQSTRQKGNGNMFALVVAYIDFM